MLPASVDQVSGENACFIVLHRVARYWVCVLPCRREEMYILAIKKLQAMVTQQVRAKER